MSNNDEQEKAMVCGVDHARNGKAYVVEEQVMLAEHFFAPKNRERDENDEAIKENLIHSGIIFPMKEDKPVIKESLEYVLTLVSPKQVMVVNCESSDLAIDAVLPFVDRGVHLVNLEDVLHRVDWTQLLPILHMDAPPTSGKGLTMFAGTIAAIDLFPSHVQWIFQHDADIRQADRYDVLRHLVLPLVLHPDTYGAVKVARPSRGNETVMTARNMLQDIAHDPYCLKSVRNFARAMFCALSRHKWLLTGEFGMTKDLAFARPFATGYLDETVISFYLECVHLFKNGWEIAQVETIGNRLDDCNNDIKEFRMMDEIARTIIRLVRFEGGKPITAWGINDFKVYNELWGFVETLARIPCGDDPSTGTGPVVLERIRQNRLIPPLSLINYMIK